MASFRSCSTPPAGRPGANGAFSRRSCCPPRLSASQPRKARAWRTMCWSSASSCWARPGRTRSCSATAPSTGWSPGASSRASTCCASRRTSTRRSPGRRSPSRMCRRSTFRARSSRTWCTATATRSCRSPSTARSPRRARLRRRPQNHRILRATPAQTLALSSEWPLRRPRCWWRWSPLPSSSSCTSAAGPRKVTRARARRTRHSPSRAKPPPCSTSTTDE
mmetsp:Transcript_12643/g.32491  ORF Transcript_12643/g.32491 Transcript_12643/m.32491 type:complete len:221 (-) Transcript_12643:1344-2006(-)